MRAIGSCRAMSAILLAMGMIASSLVHAQSPVTSAIVRDGTIGGSGQPTPVPDGDGLLFEIGEGFGEGSGRNLFHSFDRFDVATPDTVRFTADPSSTFANVIARVTGARSRVYGTIESRVSEANLYLINPRGVVFGPDARIDVPAAFVVSSADELGFGDLRRLGTQAVAPGPLSSVDPTAFGFLGGTVGDLVVEGALELDEGQDFAWIGGDLRLDGDSGLGVISAVAGDVTLVSVASAGTVAFDVASDAPPSLPASARLGQITIVNDAILSSSGLSPLQRFLFNADDPASMVVTIGSRRSSTGSVPEGATALIDRPLAGGQRSVIYYAPSYDSPRPGPSALRGAGRITIRADDLLIDDSDIRAETVGLDARSIDVELTGQLEIVKAERDADVGLLATTGRTAQGFILLNLPNIGCEGAVVDCSRVLEEDGSWTGRVLLGDPERGLEVELKGGEGRGADILVQAASLTLRDGARISTTSLSGGAPGSIDIETTGDVRLVGRDPMATGQPNVIESSAIASNHQGRPTREEAFAGGAIEIDAKVLLLEDGGGLFAQTAGDGNAGDIGITVEELIVRDDSQIDSSTSGQLLGPEPPMGVTKSGASGAITVVASERVLLEGRLGERDFARLSTLSRQESRGGDGTIHVTAPSVTVRDGAGIAVTTEGEGTRGDVRIDAGALTVATGGSISASSEAIGEPAGVIGVTTTGSVRVERGGSLTANTGRATGGNITIGSGEVMFVGEDARITANAEIAGGTGGRVTIDAPLLIRSAASVITASAPGGPEFQGRVEIRSPIVELASAVQPPETDFLDAGDLLLDRCAARRSGERAGSFRVSRARGLPTANEENLVAFADPPTAFSQARQQADERESLGPGGSEALALALRGTAEAESGPRDPMEIVRLDPLLAEVGTALDADRPGRALETLARATETIDSLPVDARRVALAIHLAEAYGRLAQRTPAIRRPTLLAAHRLLLDASAEAGAIDDSRLRSWALGTLGALYGLEPGRSTEALYLSRRARHLAEQTSAPDLEARWSAQVGRLLLDDGDPDAAVTAYARAVELLDEVRRAQATQDDPMRFRRAVEPAYLGLVDARLEAAAKAPPAEAARHLLAARDTVERWKAAELRDYFRDDCVAALEARARPLETVAPNAAIVYPIMLEDRLELLVSTREGPTRHSVPVRRDELLDVVERFRDTLQIRTRYAFRPAAEQLHEWLVEPYLESLLARGVDTLVVVPDGALRTIPFGALHDGRGFLVERVAVAVTPSLRLIEPRPFVPEASRPLVAGLSEAVQGFPALENVRREVEAVQALVGGDLLVDARFQTGRLETVLRERPPTMIHLASHAEFTGDPRTSFVLAHDRRLPIGELATWIEANRFGEAPLELLVLSACETAAGDDRAALGLAGLAIRAGARSVLGSLWSVNDEATSRLIVSFYQALAASSELSKVEALAQSQRALIRDRRFDHPFYWAGFLILNNWL